MLLYSNFLRFFCCFFKFNVLYSVCSQTATLSLILFVVSLSFLSNGAVNRPLGSLCRSLKIEWGKINCKGGFVLDYTIAELGVIFCEYSLGFALICLGVSAILDSISKLKK